MTARINRVKVKTKHKRGPKTKLTPAVIKKLRPFVEEGFTDQTLARIAKVTKGTFNVWKRKSKTAKSGSLYQFKLLYEDIESAEQKLVVTALVDKIKERDIKAVELAMRRHPRLRSEFKEAPTGIEQAGAFEFKVEFVPVRKHDEQHDEPNEQTGQ